MEILSLFIFKMIKNKFKENSKSVFYFKKKNNITLLEKKDLTFLKLRKNQKNFKSRICVHDSENENIHEMFVFHKKGSYVRPHKHLNKLESLFLIKGELKLLIFDAKGSLLKIVEMGSFDSGKVYFYKMKKNFFHTQIIKKDTIFKEVTNGPFSKRKTLLAKWSPKEGMHKEIKKYLNYLKNCRVKSS